jgi:heptosyltransferase III
MRQTRSLLLRLVALLLWRRRAAAAQPQRILVIKPDHLGDVLLLTPALRRLRQALPAAHLALMIGPWSRDAIRGNPDLDALSFCEFPGFTRKPKPGLLQPYWLLLRMAMLVRRGRYDVALIARDDHWWGALLALLAGIPRRIGYDAPDVGMLLTDALPYDPTAHVTTQALDLVDHVVGTASTPPDQTTPMVAPITPEDVEWADLWMVAHGCDQGRRLVAIHPGAGGPAKLWVAARWAMIVDTLHARGYTVVLTGGPGELTLVERIRGRLARPPLVLAGEATLGGLAALYQRCELVLGVDSGPMHLAATTGTRTIVLFGPIDHRRFGPWGPPERHTIVRSGLWCSPCGMLDRCPRGTNPAECMTSISVQQVLSEIDRLPPPSAPQSRMSLLEAGGSPAGGTAGVGSPIGGC